MTVAYKYERGTDKKESIGAFQDYLDYLEDPTHEDHEGITLLPGRNYNCGPSREDLIAAVERMHENYIEIKDAKKHNRRTYNLWDEIIHNLGEGCYVTPEERDAIERRIIAKLCPDTPARATWHINEATGECDLHIVFAVKRPNGKLTLERTNIGLSKRLDALDQFAADLLNKSKTKPKKRKDHIETCAEVAKKNSAEIALIYGRPKPVPLHVQIAYLAEKEGLEEVEGYHLPGLLERLGYRIKEIISGVIYYFSKRTSFVSKNQIDPDAGDIRKSRIGTIRVDSDLFKILEAQMDIRIERDRLKSLEAAQSIPIPEAIPEITPEVIPEVTPEVTPEVIPEAIPRVFPEILPEILPETATRSSDKAAKLKEYLEASLGITKLKSREYTALTKATKGLLKSDGTIARSLLKELSSDEKAALVKLAAAHAREIK